MEVYDLLAGKGLDNESLIEKTALQVEKEVKPPEAGRISAEYRRHLAGVMFRDVFWKAWQRAAGETS